MHLHMSRAQARVTTAMEQDVRHTDRHKKANVRWYVPIQEVNSLRVTCVESNRFPRINSHTDFDVLSSC